MPCDRYVSASTTFQLPAVVLDHSSHIEYSRVQEDMVTVVFNDIAAFEIAADQWTETLPFILVSAVDTDDGHFRYLTVSAVECLQDSMTCTMSTSDTHFDDAIDEFEITFGNYHELMGKRSQAPWTSGQEDLALDRALGYYNFDESHFTDSMDGFIEGLDNPKYSDFTDTNSDDDGIFDENGLIDINPVLEPDPSDFERRKRGFIDDTKAGWRALKDPKARQAAKQAAFAIPHQMAKQTYSSVKSTYNELSDRVLGDVSKYVQYVDGSDQRLPLSGKTNIGAGSILDEKDSPFVDEKSKPYKAFLMWNSDKEKSWGPKSKQIKLEGAAKVYCLSCGVNLDYSITGTIAYKLGTGLTKATITFDGKFEAALRLGFVLKGSVTAGTQKRMGEVGIPGFQIPGFLTIGPMLSFDFKTEITLGLQGMAMAGVTTGVRVKHTIDLLDSNNKKQAEVTTESSAQFEASAEVSLTLTMSFPMSVAFGLSVANGKAKATGDIILEPGLEAKASIGASFKFGAATGSGVAVEASWASEECKGFNVATKAFLQLYAEAQVDLIVKKFKTTKYKIMNDKEIEIWKKCIAFGSKKATRREITNSTVPASNELGMAMALTEPAQTLKDSPNPIIPFPDWKDEPFQLPAAVAAFVSDNPPNFASPLQTDPKDSKQTAFNYTIVGTTNGRINLAATTEGNFGFTTSDGILEGSQLFAVYDDMVIGDATGRLLVYFSQEMNKYNVSRIRLEPSGQIPKTSRMITLTPIPVAQTLPGLPSAVLLAIDSIARVFIPVICNYANGEPSKMFIVSHLDSGIKTLKDTATDKQITAGAITDCQYLPLSNGLPAVY